MSVVAPRASASQNAEVANTAPAKNPQRRETNRPTAKAMNKTVTRADSAEGRRAANSLTPNK